MKKITLILALFGLGMSLSTTLAQDLRKNGSIYGKVESNGDVRMNGSIVGKIESNGDVRKNGSIIGSAQGVDREQAAVMFFFDFF